MGQRSVVGYTVHGIGESGTTERVIPKWGDSLHRLQGCVRNQGLVEPTWSSLDRNMVSLCFMGIAGPSWPCPCTPLWVPQWLRPPGCVHSG